MLALAKGLKSIICAPQFLISICQRAPLGSHFRSGLLFWLYASKKALFADNPLSFPLTTLSPLMDVWGMRTLSVIFLAPSHGCPESRKGEGSLWDMVKNGHKYLNEKENEKMQELEIGPECILSIFLSPPKLLGSLCRKHY